MVSEVSANRDAGNFRYLAPERVDPDSEDVRRTMASDVYAFACVCLLVSLRVYYWLTYIAHLNI
jgi:hypothetical protein